MVSVRVNTRFRVRVAVRVRVNAKGFDTECGEAAGQAWKNEAV